MRFAKLRSFLATSITAVLLGVAPPAVRAEQSLSINYLLQDSEPSPSDVVLPSNPDQADPQPDAAQRSQRGLRKPVAPVRPAPAPPQFADDAEAGDEPASPAAERLSEAVPLGKQPLEQQAGPSASSTAPLRPGVITRGISDFYASPLATYLGTGEGRSNPEPNRYFGSDSHTSLLRTPEMFSHVRRPGPSISFVPEVRTPSGQSLETRPYEFPMASSISGLSIAENNYALPQDRVWFSYSHMHHAFAQPGGDLSLDRLVVAAEKTFLGGSSSLEIRMPLAAELDSDTPLTGTTVYSNGSFGNLSLIGKRVLIADDQRVICYGLGIETPTGSRSHALDTANGPISLTIDPNAVYLTPYLGALRRFNDSWFGHGFLQVEVPTSGDSLQITRGAIGAEQFRINSSTRLDIDLAGGVWLLAPERCDPSGLALLSELHIATPLNAADEIIVQPAYTPNVYVNTGDSVRTLVDYTAGIHAALGNGWAARAGISVPLITERIFDTAVTVQMNCRF